MQEVDTSKSPYYDDYNAAKNYHEILFLPSRAVQVRELNQIQSMFKEQIKLFGNHIFENGSVVIPGETNYDFNFPYVTVTITNRQTVIGYLNSTDIQLTNSNGITANLKLFAEAVNSDPDTFYIEYINASTDGLTTKFQASDTINIVLGGNTIGTATIIANGTGSKFTINSGVYYLNGRFVLVSEETVLLDKYSTTPSKIVGITYNEVDVSESLDNTLFDNAQGTPNFSAPGAHRLRVDTALAVYDLTSLNTLPTDFVEIFRVDAGQVQLKYRGPNYSVLGDVLAQRTYEESGDYTVKSFGIGFNTYNAAFGTVDDTKFAVQLDPGIAYVKGYRVETTSKTNIAVDKARQTGIINNSSLSAALGYYVDVNTLTSLPSITALQSVNIKNSGGTVIGTARIRFISEPTAGNFRLYLFDVRDPSGNATTSFFANAVTIDSTDTVTFSCTVSDPVLNEASYNSLIFPLNVDYVKTLKPAGTSDTSYASVKQLTGTLDSNGQITFTAASTEEFVAQDSVYAFGVYTDDNSTLDVASNYTLGGTPTGSTITLNMTATNASRPVRVNIQVAKQQVTQKTKTVQAGSVSGSLTQNKLSLGKADVYEITSITDSGSNDVTSMFTLVENKTNSFYDISYVTTTSTVAQPITVNFNYFSHGTGDYFGPDSYAGISYDSIPSENGVRLSDVLDFRPRINDAGTGFTGVGSSVGNIPTPYTIVRADVEHYLPRIDKVYVKSNGTFGVVEGVPSLNPSEPNDPSESMVLYSMSVPAYTFAISDIQAQKVKNRRYTMKDIGALDERLSNVEYYVALNSLEQEANSAQVLDATTGTNRFKNGFLTDRFVDHSVGDYTWTGYHVAMADEGNVRPEFSLNAVDLAYDATNSSNIVNNNGVVTLAYTEVSFIAQNQRSSYINVNPYAIYHWSGQLKLVPSVDSWIDTNYVSPDVTYKLYNNGKLTQTWKSWQLNWTGGTSYSSSSFTSQSPLHSVWQDANSTGQGAWYGGYSGYRRKTTTYTTTTSTRTNVDVISDRVIDTSVVPYMRSIDIDITGKGNRPTTKMHFFFDGTNVNAFVKPSGGAYGADVITDANGAFSAVFTIPNDSVNHFRTGQKQLVATDDVNDVETSSTSYAQSTFTSTGIRQTKQRTIVATRNINTTSTAGVRWDDPLAQSFLVESDGGIFITKMNLYFQSKDSNVPVKLQIREMENGIPTQTVVPGAEVLLLPSEVNTSTDGSTATTFQFDHPVYLQDGIEYCFVVKSNSNNYTIFIAKMGEVDLSTGQYIVKQPYAGIMFKSQNNSTWTEDQTADIQFEIFQAQFDTAVTGTLITENIDLKTVLLTANPIATTNASTTLTIYRENHNYVVGTVIQLSGATAGNNITTGDLNGVNLTVASIVDPDHFTVVVASTANATGDIGGSVVYITDTIQASVLNPNIPTIELPGTALSFEAKGTTGKSIDGSETAYSVSSSYSSISNNAVNQLSYPWLITNTIDETANTQGAKTLTIKATMSTTKSNLSPVIDLTGASIITPFYQITGKGTTNADGSNNWANYRTKVTSLTTPADMLRVYLDIQQADGSSVVVSAKVGNSQEEIDAATWFEISNVSTSTIVSDSSFYENTFEKLGISSFTQYQIMIQLKSTSAANVPVCEKLRVLALQTF